MQALQSGGRPFFHNFACDSPISFRKRYHIRGVKAEGCFPIDSVPGDAEIEDQILFCGREDVRNALIYSLHPGIIAAGHGIGEISQTESYPGVSTV
jgi:hypothetical protein